VDSVENFNNINKDYDDKLTVVTENSVN
jgi:hypothetical protein